MKVIVTNDFICNVARTERLCYGHWFIPMKNGKCVACLLGNTFKQLTPVEKQDFIERSISTAIMTEINDIPAREVVDCVAEYFNPDELREGLKSGQFNRSLSYCFETLGRREEVGDEITLLAREELIKRIRDYFPEEFELEVDGLELLTRLPEGVRRIE